MDINSDKLIDLRQSKELTNIQVNIVNSEEQAMKVKPENLYLETPKQTQSNKITSQQDLIYKPCCCDHAPPCMSIKNGKKFYKLIELTPSKEITNKQLNTARSEAQAIKNKHNNVSLTTEKQTQYPQTISKQDLNSITSSCNNKTSQSTHKINKIEEQQSTSSISLGPSKEITYKQVTSRCDNKTSESLLKIIKNEDQLSTSSINLRPAKEISTTIVKKPSDTFVNPLDKKNKLNAHKPSKETLTKVKKQHQGLFIGTMPSQNQKKSTIKWRIGKYQKVHEKHQPMITIEKRNSSILINKKIPNGIDRLNQNSEDMTIKVRTTGNSNQYQQTNNKSLWSKLLKRGKCMYRRPSQPFDGDTSKMHKHNIDSKSKWCNQCKKPCSLSGQPVNKRESKHPNNSGIRELFSKQRKRKKKKKPYFAKTETRQQFRL